MNSNCIPGVSRGYELLDVRHFISQNMFPLCDPGLGRPKFNYWYKSYKHKTKHGYLALDNRSYMYTTTITDYYFDEYYEDVRPGMRLYFTLDEKTKRWATGSRPPYAL